MPTLAEIDAELARRGIGTPKPNDALAVPSPADPLAQPGPTQARAVEDELARRERLRKIASVSLPTNPGASDIYSDAFTLGLMKPVHALATSLGGELNEALGTGEAASFGERWREGTGSYQDMLDKARENAGWGGTAAEVGGALTSGMGKAAVKPVIGLGETVLKAARDAGIMGAVEGAARSSEDPVSAGFGALTGGAAGAATGGILSAGTTALANRFTRPSGWLERRRGPSPESLKGEAKASFKALDDAGIYYDIGQSKGLAQRITDTLDAPDAAFDAQLHPKSAAVLARIQKEGEKGPLSLTKLQTLRQLARDAASAPDPSERRIGNMIIGQIDEFVEGTDPTLGSIPSQEIARLWKDARAKWRSARTSEDINYKIEKGKARAASTASGGNVENAVRQNARSILERAEKPTGPKIYTDAEIEQLRKVVEGGGAMHNAMRGFGNTFGGSGPMGLAPGGGSMAVLSQLGVDPLVSATVGAGLTGAGKLARAGSRGLTVANADELIRLVASGGMPPEELINNPKLRALVERAARGMGVYAGGEADKRF